MYAVEEIHARKQQTPHEKQKAKKQVYDEMREKKMFDSIVQFLFRCADNQIFVRVF